MTLVFEHSRAKFLHLVRQPAYVVGTLVLPSLFFLFFAAPNATDAARANLLMASFAAFAVLGVAFFQFGLDFAVERDSAWFAYLRTLPVRPWQFLMARSLTALVFALLAATTVECVVLMTTPANVTALDLVRLNLVLILGSLPFCLLGLAVVSFTSASAALPITNLVYLLLSFAGGLWIPPAGLSPVIRDISVYLPSRFYAELAWASLSLTDVKPEHVVGLVVTALATLPLAIRSLKRN